MTCKDCIHYDVCKDDYNCGYLFKDENGNYFTDDCQHFKRKADFVEVVRCKDCTRANKYKERYFCSCDNTQMKPDDFCSYGVRRTDNAL